MKAELRHRHSGFTVVYPSALFFSYGSTKYEDSATAWLQTLSAKKTEAKSNGNKGDQAGPKITNLGASAFLVSDLSTRQRPKLIVDKDEKDPLVVTSVSLSPRFLRLVSSIKALLCASSNAT